MSSPTTPIVYNFNGPDENPLSENGTFTTPIRSGLQVIRRQSQVCSAASAAATCEGYVNNASFADVESHITLSGLSANAANSIQLWNRITGEGGAGTVDCYTCVLKFVSGSNYQIELFRVVNAAFTSLGIVSNQLTPVNGDRMLYKVTGTGATVTLEASLLSGGVWRTVGTVYDQSASRLTATGRVGMALIDSTAGGMTVDAYGFGTPAPNLSSIALPVSHAYH